MNQHGQIHLSADRIYPFDARAKMAITTLPSPRCLYSMAKCDVRLRIRRSLRAYIHYVERLWRDATGVAAHVHHSAHAEETEHV